MEAIQCDRWRSSSAILVEQRLSISDNVRLNTSLYLYGKYKNCVKTIKEKEKIEPDKLDHVVQLFLLVAV